ncbi:hypothetical protein Ddc_22546 [Ditylenchus destructor]|nr:hypothetical protein Ddc_22546 [Ditylenchus destructor]
MDSSGDGAAKFKDLSKNFVPLMDIADQVAGDIAKLFNATDKRDLTIAAQKLDVIYRKLERYKTVKSDPHAPRPTQYLNENEKEFIQREEDAILQLLTIPFGRVSSDVGLTLSGTNLTGLIAITSCHEATAHGASVYITASNLAVVARNIARSEIHRYGPSAVDNVYGDIHDVILKLTFYYPVCLASAKLFGSSQEITAFNCALYKNTFLLDSVTGLTLRPIPGPQRPRFCTRTDFRVLAAQSARPGTQPPNSTTHTDNL